MDVEKANEELDAIANDAKDTTRWEWMQEPIGPVIESYVCGKCRRVVASQKRVTELFRRGRRRA